MQQMFFSQNKSLLLLMSYFDLRFIHDVALRKTMLKGHLQAWTWQDEWDGLTMEVKYLGLYYQDSK